MRQNLDSEVCSLADDVICLSVMLAVCLCLVFSVFLSLLVWPLALRIVSSAAHGIT